MNVVITDRRIVSSPAPGANTWEAVACPPGWMISTSDYYPFGMEMPGRQNVDQLSGPVPVPLPVSYNLDYRYAYNGMETDGEVSGDGNSYTTEFRQYDPRIGRWKSLDPLMHQFPWMSPYVAFDNNPVFYVDPFGLAAGGPEEPPSQKKDENGNSVDWENGDTWINENEDGTHTLYTYRSRSESEDDDVWTSKKVKVREAVEVNARTDSYYHKLGRDQVEVYPVLTGSGTVDYSITMSALIFSYLRSNLAGRLLYNYAFGFGKPIELSNQDIIDIWPEYDADGNPILPIKIENLGLLADGDIETLKFTDIRATPSGTLGQYTMYISGIVTTESTVVGSLTSEPTAEKVFRGIVLIVDAYDFDPHVVERLNGGEESNQELQCAFARSCIKGIGFKVTGVLHVVQYGDGPLTDLNGNILSK